MTNHKLSNYQKRAIEIKMLCEFLDQHLILMQDGIKLNDKEKIEKEKTELNSIRERLEELGFYS